MACLVAAIHARGLTSNFLFRIVLAAAWLSASGGTAAEPTRLPPRAAQSTDVHGDPLPAGALARLGTVRLRQDVHRTGLAFTRDGQQLVSSWLGHLRLWDRQSGRLVRTIELPDFNLRKFVISRDGQRIAALGSIYDESIPQSFSALRVYDTASGEQLAEMRWNHRGGERGGLALIDQGRTVIVGGEDGVLRFWDVATSQELLSYKIAQRRIEDLDVSADGTTIAVVGGDPQIAVWDWQAGGQPRQIAIGTRGATAIRFLSDARIVAVSSDGREGARLLDIESGRQVRPLLGTVNGDYIRQVEVAADGGAIALPSYFENAVVVVSPDTGNILQRLKMAPHRPSCVAISADSQWVAAAGSNTALFVWNLVTGERLHADLHGHEDEVSGGIGFSNDGTEVVTASQDGTVRVWNAATGRERLKLQHDEAVGGMAISPDGSLIASNSSDDTVRVWDAADGRERFRLAGHERLGLNFRLVQFTPDSLRLSAWGGDMYLRLWDMANGKALAEHDLQASGLRGFRPDETGNFGDDAAPTVNTAAFSPDCRLFAAEFQQQVHVLDVLSGREHHKFALPPGGLSAVVFTPDSQQLITLQVGLPVQIKLANGMVRHTRERITTLRAWQIAAAKPRLEITIPGSGFNRLAVSRDGRLVAIGIGGPPVEVLIWDLQTGNERLRLEVNDGAARTLAFSPDGQRLAAGLSSGSALVWDIGAAHKPQE